MAIVLDGTSGITTPTIENQSGVLALKTGGTTAVTIDTSQNVGIGTSSPAGKLHVVGATTNTGVLVSNVTSGLNIGMIGNYASWQGSGTSDDFVISGYGVRSLILGTNGAQRMTIDSSGNLLVGTTSIPAPSGISTSGLVVNNAANNGNWIGTLQSSGASNNRALAISYSAATPNDGYNEAIFFRDATAVRFIVKSNGGISNYSANNTNLSDERTKKDITNAGDYLAKICAIPVRTFSYKDQTDTDLNLGVIAQEVEAVAPELVDSNGFGETPEDGIPLKAIYQTDLQYALMKCIQELKAIIDTQQEQIKALQGALDMSSIVVDSMKGVL